MGTEIYCQLAITLSQHNCDLIMSHAKVHSKMVIDLRRMADFRDEMIYMSPEEICFSRVTSSG
jgi:hypothetical protein